MKPGKFMISGTLFFALVGPPVGSLTLCAIVASLGPAKGMEGLARVLLIALPYSYLPGLLPALMAGILCCSAMLAASRFLPQWAHARRPVTRSTLVAAISAVFMLIYLIPGVRVGRIDGPLLVYHLMLLVPFVICASFVNWRLLPKLEWKRAGGGVG